MLDYYAILGVRRDADANAIRAAYRELARTLHPDRTNDAAAHERFKAANEAYRVLSDPAAKARYDRLGLRPEGSVYGAVSVPVAPPGFADIARAVARGVRRAVRPRGPDITLEVRLTPFEMIQGSRRIFSLPRRRRDHSVEMRRVEFALPPLLRPGQRLSWRGEGAPSDDPTLPPGQLVVHIVPAPLDNVRIEGADLISELPLRPSDALAGTTVTVTTAEGDASLVVAPRTQHGTRLTLGGRGMATARGGRGDFHHLVRIDWPADPPESVLSALRAWERAAEAVGR